MEDMIFWQHWEELKYIFDEMQNALIKAKEKSPASDYSIPEKKLKIISEIQAYLGTQQERVTVVKELNRDLNHKLFLLQQAHHELAEERNALKKENEKLKQSIADHISRA